MPLIFFVVHIWNSQEENQREHDTDRAIEDEIKTKRNLSCERHLNSQH